ncbi:uncharacterized protein K460DRAFT_339177 [Cucurbitaria berberidis CBS 394.84]|uniref:Uncharacterized protein n=1 Tax=Cucurbitaria berberidis CBS 394.84 TaxID=1168544 RepID=A0A9P4L8L7_9PLEO|nr:uncharacterized protein K460DRAFT_339177 [Cucurbitaria berberidis CBS 394.84]KAF1846185.1 hypothetical protein K460DRAFT_339177 [Cucurbitaria berberidis CBS 394.84]
MPPPRNAPTRSSQRRNSLQDDTPVRTRAGRGAKSGLSRPDPPEIVAPKATPTKLSPNVARKATRSASNISGQSFEAAPEVYASYEDPLFMVFGISHEFFDGLKKHHGKLPKQRKVIISSLPQQSPSSDDSDSSDEESVEESEVDAPIVPQPAPRGGRGRGRGRGGRGRGGRGRGRGGRPRGGGAVRTTSPVRARPSRNAAPMFPLTEEDDDQPSNQTMNAKPLRRIHGSEPSPDSDSSEVEDEQEIDDGDTDDGEPMEGVQNQSTTPGGSPPPKFHASIIGGTYTPHHTSATTLGLDSERKTTTINKIPVPRISLPTGSATQTPRDGTSTPATSAVSRLLDPDDDVLSDSDLPEAWIEHAPLPTEAECEDRADYLLQKRFKPMTDVQAIVAALTKFPASQRSTANLYALTQNAQSILKAWQDEYLMLDARTAPHMHPPKKACNGGRNPLATDIFEDLKEADLYGYTYDPKKLPGCQNPWAQRPGAEKSGGRELRTRRTRDMLDSAAASEEEEEEDEEGRPAKRQRKATRKFDGTDSGNGTNTPKKHNGWGGARKKGVSRFANTTSETPEPEGRLAKRARTAATNLLHQRIQEMREESAFGSSGDEGSSAMDVDDYSDANPKRGRPAGSKNVARRSDYGVKKGPRKKTSETGTPAPSAHGPNAPPPALNSLSEGQGQFTIDAQPFPDTPSLVANSAETVFQATPQHSTLQEVPLIHPSESTTPDAYMITAPLSQYTNNYVEESTPTSGSRRKPRVKSEKRSHSMTIWWAERKARKREQDEKNGTPVKAPASRSNSSSGKKGGRTSGDSVTATTPQATPSEAQQQQQEPSPTYHPQHPPPEAYAPYATPGPFSGPPQHYMYVSAPPAHPMMMQYSPLAALPSGSFPAYSGAPPPNSQYGPRALAPAPMPLQHVPTYPSPYGPQSPAGSGPKSSGQPPRSGPPALAPAPPQHYSPYAPIGADRQMPFKVMVPGPTTTEERRDSR